MIICCDVDETLVLNAHSGEYHYTRPTKPNVELISILQKAKARGATIILHTARGQLSCEGNLETIECKLRKPLEDWLALHKVPYDQLLFGKPLADVYIDDKACLPHDAKQILGEP